LEDLHAIPLADVLLDLGSYLQVLREYVASGTLLPQTAAAALQQLRVWLQEHHQLLGGSSISQLLQQMEAAEGSFLQQVQGAAAAAAPEAMATGDPDAPAATNSTGAAADVAAPTAAAAAAAAAAAPPAAMAAAGPHAPAAANNTVVAAAAAEAAAAAQADQSAPDITQAAAQQVYQGLAEGLSSAAAAALAAVEDTWGVQQATNWAQLDPLAWGLQEQRNLCDTVGRQHGLSGACTAAGRYFCGVVTCSCGPVAVVLMLPGNVAACATGFAATRAGLCFPGGLKQFTSHLTAVHNA
jgi:hypothetical protein